jgi:glycerol-3-phosphate cytidylyltransferase-like family protein
MISKDKNLWLFGSWFGTRYADILVMGDDWKGKFDWVKESSACDVLYLPRTPSTSTTEITEIIEIVKSID